MLLHLPQRQMFPGPTFPMVLPPCLPKGICTCGGMDMAAFFTHADQKEEVLGVREQYIGLFQLVLPAVTQPSLDEVPTGMLTRGILKSTSQPFPFSSGEHHLGAICSCPIKERWKKNPIKPPKHTGPSENLAFCCPRVGPPHWAHVSQGGETLKPPPP